MKEEIIQGFRLSPQQKHLWLLQQGRETFPYWTRCSVRIFGNLNQATLEKAIRQVVSEHEILRTGFKLLYGMSIPVQVISEEASISFKSHDLTLSNAREQQESFEQLFVASPFRQSDFDAPHLFHVDLLKLSAVENRLLLRLPAMCSDDRSLENMVRQIANAYGSDSNQQLQVMQYADFAEWQNELLESDDSAAGRSHWKKDLSHALELKFYFENQSSATEFQLAKIAIGIDRGTLQAITDQVGQKELVSSFVLACWQTLIWRLTGVSEVVVGRMFAGRKYKELESSIGLHARYVPIPIELKEGLTFAQLLKRVSDAEQEAYQWQEYFSWEGIQRPDGVATEPYFPLCFETLDVVQKISAGELVFSVDRVESCTDRFALKLVCADRDDALSLELYYDVTRFAAEDAKRLGNELQTLIEDASKRPETAIECLKILNSVDRHQILVEFNDITEEVQSHCIHELIEASSKRFPEKVALVYESGELTYAQLNSRANQLAHYLGRLGVGPDVRVGLCLDRSLDLVVGLLGILRAGGAYVPLDPAMPADRLRMMLEDAGAQIVVSEDRFSKDFSQFRCVRLDSDHHLLAGESTQNPINLATPKNLVYVIFTSGSTGRSKGVAVEHRQLVNYLSAIQNRLRFSEGASFAMVSTLAADLGNTVLFPSLITGGTLHLISEERIADADALAEYFQNHPADCLKIVPSHLTALLSASHPADILPRQKLILGGEACPRGLIEMIDRLPSLCDLFNHYGPTEATVGAVAGPIDRASASGVIALGRPLANVKIYLLDKRLEPVPIGASGELYVGGHGVARGYVNQPEKTAEKFIPDPFSGEAGARLYKTGDLARYRTDGVIEFVGRVDYQLKVHGHRIEPGEIETAIRGHAGVSETVVVAREDQPGDKRLVAYLVPQRSQTLSVSELRAFLRDKLPEYMLPSAFVFLDRLPLNANGKVDRRALPAPEAPVARDGFVAPRNHVEEVLAQIWAGVLGLDSVGVFENFFELGGDSILSIQIIARANQAGLRLSPRQLFQHQTIAELATVAGDGLHHKAEQGVVTGPVPLTPVQARFFAQKLPEPHHYNQAMLVEVREPPDKHLLQSAIQELVTHHDALRLRFSIVESGWQQTNAAPDATVPFEWKDISGMAETQQGTAIEEFAAKLHASLDLEKGPIIRTALFYRGPNETAYLLIVIHHLAVDTVSWRILLEDLERLYRELQSGKGVSLPPKTTSFKSWAERLLEHAQSDALKEEIPYWLSLFQEPVRALPMDTAQGENVVASARTVSVSLSGEETRALLQDLPAAFRTQINEVLLTALARTFSNWTGSSTVLLDMEGHGREEILEAVDLSRTVGWFTTIFPVVLRIEPSSTPTESLRVVKEQLRAIPNRGIGYGLLRYLSSNTALVDGRENFPQAQIRFNYLGQLDRALNQTSLFAPADRSSGPTQSAKGSRAYLLNIIGAVSNGRLRFEWTYSANVHRHETVERLARKYIQELQTLIALSGRSDEASYLPSDFPKAKLSKEDLNKVLAKLRG